MGRVRTKLVKRAARQIIEKYFSRLTNDFDTNKRVCAEVAVIPSKSLRNKIAGYITHLMKRIERERGPIRGISLKLQEEERERRMDFIPERSALDVDVVEIDQDTALMLKAIDFPEVSGTKVVSVLDAQQPRPAPRGERPERKRQPRPRTEAPAQPAAETASAPSA